MICKSCNFWFEEPGCMLDKTPDNNECFLYEEYDAQLEFMFKECSEGGD